MYEERWKLLLKRKTEIVDLEVKQSKDLKSLRKDLFEIKFSVRKRVITGRERKINKLKNQLIEVI